MRISFCSMVIITAMLLAGCAGPKTTTHVFQPYSGNNSSNVADFRSNSVSPAIETAPTVAPVPSATVTKPVEPETSVATITVVQGLKGRIASANAELKFVVITFPVGQMARTDQRLTVYREGLKVGELTVTGPPLDDSIVADISAGEAKVGDEVRDK